MAGKEIGEIAEALGIACMEAPLSQPHGGPREFIGAVALSREEKETGFFVNTIALTPAGFPIIWQENAKEFCGSTSEPDRRSLRTDPAQENIDKNLAPLYNVMWMNL